MRAGNLKTNRPTVLYQTESSIISVASSPDGRAILGGHADGTIIRFFFDTNGATGDEDQGQQVSALSWVSISMRNRLFDRPARRAALLFARRLRTH